MTDAQVDSKRIIICCDGTWQSAVSGQKNMPTNVTRLARCLARAGKDKDGKVWQQVVWYDSGVGTTSGWLGRKLEGAVGQGLEYNVIEAYNFCVLNYAPGDQILVFGFSRGAYTARAISGLISDIGICQPASLHRFHEIWELYKECPPGWRFHGSDAYYDYIDGVPADPKDQPDDLGYKGKDIVWKSPAHADWEENNFGRDSREIEVVGVYDTVGSLGMPQVFGYNAKIAFGSDKVGYHNVRLNRNIKHAFHALALDEHREAFTPTLWHVPEKADISDEQFQTQENLKNTLGAEWSAVMFDKKISPQDRLAKKAKYYEARRLLSRFRELRKPQSELLQVWFPGVHINIGGGSSDTLENKGDLEETSTITFSWMLDQIKPYVSLDRNAYFEEAIFRAKYLYGLNQKAKAAQAKIDADKEKAAKAGWGSYFASKISGAASTIVSPITGGPEVPDLTIRKDGWGTGTIIDSYSWMYAPNGSLLRTPGAYIKDASGPEGETNEYVHPTVGYRMQYTKDFAAKEKYLPLGKDTIKRQQRPDGSWEYIFKTADKKTLTLPEYQLPLHPEDMGSPMDGSFERFVVLGEDAQKYVRVLDGQLKNPPQSLGMPMSMPSN